MSLDKIPIIIEKLKQKKKKLIKDIVYPKV